MVSDPLRSVPVRDRPEVLSGVQIDGGDVAVRRLEHRYALDLTEAAATTRDEIDHGLAARLLGRAVVALGPGRECRSTARGDRSDVHDARFGVGDRPARNVEAAREARADRGGAITVGVGDDRRVEEGAGLQTGRRLDRPLPQLRSPVDQVVFREPLDPVRGWPGREGLCRRGLLSRYRGLRDRSFLDRPDRLARFPVEYKGEVVLRVLYDGRD